MMVSAYVKMLETQRDGLELRVAELTQLLSEAKSTGPCETCVRYNKPPDTELRDVVFKVLEGFTLPYEVRKLLEMAYYTA